MNLISGRVFARVRCVQGRQTGAGTATECPPCVSSHHTRTVLYSARFASCWYRSIKVSFNLQTSLQISSFSTCLVGLEVDHYYFGCLVRRELEGLRTRSR